LFLHSPSISSSYSIMSATDATEVKPPAAGRKINEIIAEKEAAGKPWFAFEYYPPRTEKGVENLCARFGKMQKQEPAYADMTWGAGGSTSDLTVDLCKKMVNDYGMEANMHLTCTNMLPKLVDEALAACKEANIRNIVALRGDPPHGSDKWEVTEGGFACALDLVKYIRKEHGDYFCVSVAGYPEGHPNAITPVVDESKLTEAELGRVVRNEDGVFCCHEADYAKEMAYLKEKVDAGSDFIITQMFFETGVFTRFVADCRAAGINCPIMPGIMLIQNYGGFNRMTKMCKSRVPKELSDAIHALDKTDPKEHERLVKEFGIEQGAKVCQELLDAGHNGLHLYCLNLEFVTYGVLDKLGLKKPE